MWGCVTLPSITSTCACQLRGALSTPVNGGRTISACTDGLRLVNPAILINEPATNEGMAPPDAQKHPSW